jgi:hypothetical protein
MKRESRGCISHSSWMYPRVSSPELSMTGWSWPVIPKNKHSVHYVLYCAGRTYLSWQSPSESQRSYSFLVIVITVRDELAHLCVFIGLCFVPFRFVSFRSAPLVLASPVERTPFRNNVSPQKDYCTVHVDCVVRVQYVRSVSHFVQYAVTTSQQRATSHHTQYSTVHTL